ncbi:hypothetical protein Tco_0495992 [Tanacetum coccineum]
MLAPSGGGLILYQAYGNLYTMTGRKSHLLEDKKIQSVGVFDEVFSIWKAFGGNTRDLGSFGEETDKTTDLHQHLSRISTQKLETASQITRSGVDVGLELCVLDVGLDVVGEVVVSGVVLCVFEDHIKDNPFDGVDNQLELQEWTLKQIYLVYMALQPMVLKWSSEGGVW